VNQPVYPQSVEELQHLLRTASDTEKPVYVYRQGLATGISVELAKLDEIVEIDAANLVATVRPGVKLGALAGSLARQGLRFLPADTPFYHEKTVGQFFYEGCANLASLKYGSAKHFLMGSEVVLPTGELLKTGGKTVKNVTGYDFTRFFNAPYTDYGITVKFLLKLLPLPEIRKGMALRFADLDNVLAFAKDLKDCRVVPAYLLWVDSQVQAILGDKSERQLVMLAFDGLQEEVDEQYQKADTLSKKHGGKVLESYEGSGQTPGKWTHLYQNTDKYILTDEYKLAFTRQGEFIRAFYQIRKDSGVTAGLFGQIAEGKLNIACSSAQPDNGFMEAVGAAVKQAGGVLAGKYDRLGGKAPSGILAVLEQLAKLSFDPKQILNRQLQQGVN
jgi:glycolate oxidase